MFHLFSKSAKPAQPLCITNNAQSENNVTATSAPTATATQPRRLDPRTNGAHLTGTHPATERRPHHNRLQKRLKRQHGHGQQPPTTTAPACDGYSDHRAKVIKHLLNGGKFGINSYNALNYKQLPPPDTVLEINAEHWNGDSYQLSNKYMNPSRPGKLELCGLWKNGNNTGVMLTFADFCDTDIWFNFEIFGHLASVRTDYSQITILKDQMKGGAK